MDVLFQADPDRMPDTFCWSAALSDALVSRATDLTAIPLDPDISDLAAQTAFHGTIAPHVDDQAHEAVDDESL
jgi:hypothetical protein